MVITFAGILFALCLLFRGLRNNVFFMLYAGMMILAAYLCENYLGWHVAWFKKTSLLLFLLFHIPLINLFTFIAYGHDKHAAQNHQWRIPEIQLHTLEVLGGTIGAIMGQKVFKHKYKKKSYMLGFFATIVIQVGAFLFILRYLKIW
jgi:uncharacterized membrane protein YsdA (DUF1294 family)